MDSVATTAGTPNYSIARIQLTNDEVIRSNTFQSVEQMDTGLLKDSDHQRVEDFKRDHGFLIIATYSVMPVSDLSFEDSLPKRLE